MLTISSRSHVISWGLCNNISYHGVLLIMIFCFIKWRGDIMMRLRAIYLFVTVINTLLTRFICHHTCSYIWKPYSLLIHDNKGAWFLLIHLKRLRISFNMNRIMTWILGKNIKLFDWLYIWNFWSYDLNIY